MPGYHLAQINIGRLLAPLDHPSVFGFVSQLDEINALAEQNDGFVWRLRSSAGNATDIFYNEDPLTLVNMSTWTSIEALQDFTYRSRHVEVFRARQQWFEKMALPHYCLWWVPAGHQPSVAEGRGRLEHYQEHGATPNAFWFSKIFPSPSPTTP